MVSGERFVADCQEDRRSVNTPDHSATKDMLCFDVQCVIKWFINKYLITVFTARFKIQQLTFCRRDAFVSVLRMDSDH
jgi:hypothetical protein